MLHQFTKSHRVGQRSCGLSIAPFSTTSASASENCKPKQAGHPKKSSICSTLSFRERVDSASAAMFRLIVAPKRLRSTYRPNWNRLPCLYVSRRERQSSGVGRISSVVSPTEWMTTCSVKFFNRACGAARCRTLGISWLSTSCAPPGVLPIREAIDWVHASIYTTIKGIKFSRFDPVCGGPIEVAVITTDRRFRWVRHKGLDAAMS